MGLGPDRGRCRKSPNRKRGQERVSVSDSTAFFVPAVFFNLIDRCKIARGLSI